jgi:RNA polymerase primary sigma factor
MIQRAKYMSVEFTDLVSEGSMALLRATEKFDCARGFKFSTYACRAILKSFSRAAKQNYSYHRLFPIQLDNYLEKTNKIEQSQSYDQEELVHEMQKMVMDNVAELSDIELSVVRMRFSLDEDQDSPLTLKEVGLRLGLTKERIRQIQNTALQKLRIVAEEHLVPA